MGRTTEIKTSVGHIRRELPNAAEEKVLTLVTFKLHVIRNRPTNSMLVLVSIHFAKKLD